MLVESETTLNLIRKCHRNLKTEEITEVRIKLYTALVQPGVNPPAV